jgi:hypothetical protein
MLLPRTSTLTAVFLALLLLLSGAHIEAQRWTVDLSREFSALSNGSEARPLLYSPIALQFVDDDNFLLGFDHFDRCDDQQRANEYTLLLISAANGAIKASRSFPALPESLHLVGASKSGPLVISRHSVQVIDKKSLETLRTISLSADSGKASDAELPCYSSLFGVSSTPDGSRIIVKDDQDIYDIDASSLQIRRSRLPRRTGELVAGYAGEFVHSKRRAWTWRSDADGGKEQSVCDQCDHVDVLSPTDVLISTNEDFSVLRGGNETIWKTHRMGMRDDFDADAAGTRFVVLMSEGNGPLLPHLWFRPIVFDVEKKKSAVLHSIPGRSDGGNPTAAAISADGDQVAVFCNGKIAYYDLRSTNAGSR